MPEITRDARGTTSRTEPAGVIAQIEAALTAGLVQAQAPLEQALQVIVRDQGAATRAMEDNAREIRNLARQTTSMMARPGGPATGGLTRRDIANGVAEGVTTTLATILQGVQKLQDADDRQNARLAPSGTGGAVMVDHPTGQVGSSEGGVSYHTPTTDQMNPEGYRERPGPGGRAQPARWGFQGGYQQGRGYNLGQMKQDFLRNVAQHVSESNYGAATATQNLQIPGFGGGNINLGPAIQGADGSIAAASEGEVAAALRSGGIRQAGLNALRAGASGEGVSGMVGALGAGAAEMAGGVGAVVTAAQWGIGQAESQRRANLDYQRIYGGSNASGFGQRAQEQMFGWSQMGRMGSGEGQKLFRGVSALGLQGSERDTALDEASTWFMRFGMSVEESTDLLKTATQTGVTSLSSLTDALADVGHAAREAGVNAAEAQQQFRSNFQAAAETMGGQAAVGFAGAATSEMVSQGRRFQNVSTAGMFTDNNLAMLGAQNGMTLNQTLAMARGPGGQQQLARMQQANLQRSAGVLLGRQGMSEVQDFVNQHQGEDNVSDADFEGLARNLSGGALANVDPRAIETMLTQAGVSGVTSENAVEMLTRIQSGRYDIAAAAEKQARESRSYTLSRENRNRGGDANIKGQDDLGDVAARVTGDRADALHADGKVQAFGIGRDRKAKQSDARSLYLASVKKTGRVSPLVERALKDFDPSWRFKVQTAQGDREVTMDDALRYYGDQLAKGDVEITKGSGAGTTLAEQVNMEGDSSVNVTSAKNTKLGQHGHAADGVDAGKGGAQRVLVSATPELQRLLRFSNEAGMSLDPNVPADPHGGGR